MTTWTKRFGRPACNRLMPNQGYRLRGVEEWICEGLRKRLT